MSETLGKERFRGESSRTHCSPATACMPLARQPGSGAKFASPSPPLWKLNEVMSETTSLNTTARSSFATSNREAPRDTKPTENFGSGCANACTAASPALPHRGFLIHSSTTDGSIHPLPNQECPPFVDRCISKLLLERTKPILILFGRVEARQACCVFAGGIVVISFRDKVQRAAAEQPRGKD